MRRTTVFLALVLIAAACGRKTLPVPPSAAIPTPIDDLRYTQEQGRVVLSWTPPRRTVVGSRLQGIDTFLVQRAVVPEDEYCPGCPVKFTSVIEVPYDQAMAGGDGKTARYIESVLRPNHRYIYRVRTKAGWRLVSDDSNTVNFSWAAPPLAPEGLVATAGDREVELRWQPVRRTIDQEPVKEGLRYRVYRGPDPDSLRPVGEPVAAPVFTDRGLENGRRYSYRVAAVRRAGETTVNGLFSRAVSAAPRDMTPPAPPRGVRAVKAVSAIKVIWERGADKDIAGYRIYRRLPTEKKATRIATVGAADLAFSDTFTPPAGVDNWYYAVSAYDREANESQLSREYHYESF